MAQPLKKRKLSKGPTSATVVTMKPKAQSPVMVPDVNNPAAVHYSPAMDVEQPAHKAADLLAAGMHSVQDAYRDAQALASRAYAQWSSKSRAMTNNIRIRTRQIRQERPLQLLVIIAGAAFAAGVFIRAWKARNS